MSGPALMLFASHQSTSPGPGPGPDPEPGDESLTGPSGLSVYDYAAGTKFGLSWTNGTHTASTEIHRDGVLFATVAAGATSRDIGLKAGDGTHTWKVRHVSGSSTSGFSASISTSDGVAA